MKECGSRFSTLSPGGRGGAACLSTSGNDWIAFQAAACDWLRNFSESDLASSANSICCGVLIDPERTSKMVVAWASSRDQWIERCLLRFLARPQRYIQFPDRELVYIGDCAPSVHTIKLPWRHQQDHQWHHITASHYYSSSSISFWSLCVTTFCALAPPSANERTVQRNGLYICGQSGVYQHVHMI